MRPESSPVRVCCALILEKDGVLVTQRSMQMPHPLKWEFPGGKVKDGEAPEVCIRREIREELSIEISVEAQLSPVKFSNESGKLELIPFICSHLEGIIELSEHRAFRWVPLEELDGLDWLEADVDVVQGLRRHLEQFS